MDGMKALFAFLLLLFGTGAMRAQDENDWQTLYHALMETEEGAEPADETVYEVLSDLADHPLNINTATREDLERIPFLNSFQIADIMEYLYKYGAMKTLDELILIPSLDRLQCRLLPFFCRAGSRERPPLPSLSKIWQYGHSQLSTTARIPLYTRRGDRQGFLGYRYRHDLRYLFRYTQKVQLGIVGAQDAGEPFFDRGNRKGYDFYSFYLSLQDIGRLKAFTIGRYRVSFGMGLVANTDFGMGKTMMLAMLSRSRNSIRGHATRTEADYLQGAAATVTHMKGLDASLFLSYRDIDATLSSDGSTISTILKTGYHRTTTEMERHNNATQFVAGTHFRYFNSGFHVGVTGLFTSFNKPLRPHVAQFFRQHRPSGRRFENVGLDYGYATSRIHLNGETAITGCGNVATLNSATVKASSSLSITLLQRFYSYRYQALLSRSFSDGGVVQNESGIYINTHWDASRRLLLDFYSDYAYFPWPRYQASRASQAWDEMASATLSYGDWTLFARYRLRIREKDNEQKTDLICQTEHRGRIYAIYETDRWSIKTQADIALTSYKRRSNGWMFNQTGSLIVAPWLTIHANIGYFHTRDYQSRIYLYEHSMPRTFSFLSFYGQGMRYALFVSSTLGTHFSWKAKAGVTKYFDRNHIGNGLQRIDHSSMADVEVHLKYKF